MYEVSNVENGYILKLNGQPLTLKGIGLLLFTTKEEAERYLKCIHFAKRNITAGIPE